MEDAKVTDEQLVRALRCSASVPPKDVKASEYCKGCPYSYREKLPSELGLMAEEDGFVHHCDCDKIAKDAAEKINELTAAVNDAAENFAKKLREAIEAATEAIREAASIGEVCDVCKHYNAGDADDFCVDCDWDNFEWGYEQS